MTDRQTIHLSNLRPFSLNENGISEDFRLHPFADAVRAELLRVDGTLDVRGSYGSAVALSGPVAGLAQQLVDAPHIQAHPFRVSGQSRTVFDDSRDCGSIERRQFVFSHQRRNELCILEMGIRITLQFVVEIGGDLEELTEFRIVVAQHVIDPAFADQNNLGVQRCRFRFQRHRRYQIERLSKRFDPHLMGEERAFQALPCKRHGQDFSCVENEIAAVGAMKSSGLDEIEIGNEGPHLGDMFDAANQILIRGLIFINNRSSLKFTAIDDDIDSVPS